MIVLILFIGLPLLLVFGVVPQTVGKTAEKLYLILCRLIE